jgi:hypothetical protein
MKRDCLCKPAKEPHLLSMLFMEDFRGNTRELHYAELVSLPQCHVRFSPLASYPNPQCHILCFPPLAHRGAVFVGGPLGAWKDQRLIVDSPLTQRIIAISFIMPSFLVRAKVHIKMEFSGKSVRGATVETCSRTLRKLGTKVSPRTPGPGVPCSAFYGCAPCPAQQQGREWSPVAKMSIFYDFLFL